MPTGGLYFARVAVKEEFDGEEIFDESETGAILNLGVGLLFNQRFSITPLLSFSMGFGDDDDVDSSNTSFSITALYSFGRR